MGDTLGDDDGGDEGDAVGDVKVSTSALKTRILNLPASVM